MTDTTFDTTERVASAITGAYFALVALLEQMHGQESSSGRRAILLNLRTLGPTTVPRLAAMRPVSRQYVQRLVDALEAEGLVEKRVNTAHRRSPSIALTLRGEARIDAMLAREAPVSARLAATLDRDEAEALIRGLDRIRQSARQAAEVAG
jgi:DNA-binding MarR family transcriptional regulator